MVRIFACRNLVRAGGSLVRGSSSSHQKCLGGDGGSHPEVSFNCGRGRVIGYALKRNISTTSIAYHDTKKDGHYIEVVPPPRPHNDPVGRTFGILKHDVQSLYKEMPPYSPFSTHVDLLIIGGGIIGNAIACMIRDRIPRKSLAVMVIEKDPSYTQSATALSAGCLRKQFSLKENVEMAKFGAEYLRNVRYNLNLDDEPAPDINYHPYGCLQLGNEEQAEGLQQSWLLQKELGCHVELLTKDRLEDRFPWMNLDGVECGLLGQEGEGWFDAWALHFGLKRKAYYKGTEYVHGEVVGFDFDKDVQMFVAGMEQLKDRWDIPRRATVKTPDGKLRAVHFAICIIAAGYDSGNLAEMTRIGRYKKMLSVQLPVEARKRNVYCIHAPDGPGIDCPMVIDTDGTYFRREGYAGHFVAGHAPPLEEEPYDKMNLEVDYKYFDDKVWPSLQNRVPGFNTLKLNSAWAGLYDYNRFDQSAVIGPHPYFPYVFFACGFSGYGIIMAPAIARATMEIILDGEFRTIDMTKFFFERFFVGQKIQENLVC